MNAPLLSVRAHQSRTKEGWRVSRAEGPTGAVGMGKQNDARTGEFVELVARMSIARLRRAVRHAGLCLRPGNRISLLSSGLWTLPVGDTTWGFATPSSPRRA